MARDPIDYQGWLLDALRDVVRRSLTIAARDGLPGKHHFYVTFRTGAPGVEIAPSLRASYPEEMTIVIQHQYRNLEVTGKGFAVDLSFANVWQSLVVPFAAVTTFWDPSVDFALQFPPGGEGAGGPDTVEPAPAVETRAEASPSADVVSLDAFRKR